MQKFGVDISKWQKGFNFDKAKAEGVEFVILRGAYATSKDSCFETFYKQCKDKNIPVGAYHYSMAKNTAEAKAEAQYMLNVLKGKQFEYPIYIDIEDKTQQVLGKDLLTDIIQAYCNILEQAGYYVGIYSTYSYLKSYTHIDKLDKYDKWIAQWSSKCTCPKSYGMWQFGGETNKLRSNKIAGLTCDQDYAYKDYPAIVKNAGLNGFKKDSPTNTNMTEIKPVKSVIELAVEVLAGKWGAGIERKRKLEAEGYSYKDVQTKVNEIYKLAKEVIAGKWGTGINRKKRLAKAGYSQEEIKAIQAVVNQIM